MNLRLHSEIHCSWITEQNLSKRNYQSIRIITTPARGSSFAVGFDTQEPAFRRGGSFAVGNLTRDPLLASAQAGPDGKYRSKVTIVAAPSE
jgi:hypothetical protein